MVQWLVGYSVGRRETSAATHSAVIDHVSWLREHEWSAKEAMNEEGHCTDILFLKHDSSIFNPSSSPVCDLSMTEQVRLCAVWTTLGSSKNHIQVWKTVWICYCHGMENKFCLYTTHSVLVPVSIAKPKRRMSAMPCLRCIHTWSGRAWRTCLLEQHPWRPSHFCSSFLMTIQHSRTRGGARAQLLQGCNQCNAVSSHGYC